MRHFEPWLDLPDDLPGQARGRLTAARLLADGYWMAAATDVLATVTFGDPLTATTGLGIALVIGGVLLIELGAAH
ncbi:hypothetical protein [Acrocarpospora sp. B8E8]|uniref:hypothetical protein n=1 Tax=Acrocarpospora sp. B8E8 TaxID=3153572 RepID=UPI00325CE30E